jgi:hypothetical protein
VATNTKHLSTKSISSAEWNATLVDQEEETKEINQATPIAGTTKEVELSLQKATNVRHSELLLDIILRSTFLL